MAHTPYYRLFLSEAVHTLWEGGDLNLDDYKSDIRRIAKYPDAMAEILITIGEYKNKKWLSVEEGDWCQYRIHEDGKKCKAGIEELAVCN